MGDHEVTTGFQCFKNQPWPNDLDDLVVPPF